MAKTAQQVAQKWASRLGSATTTIKQGVMAVQMSPGAAAARQADVWVQNTTAAKAKFQRNAAAVSLQDWQTATIDKGVARVGPGATAAVPKMAQVMGTLLPFIDRLKGSLPPRGTTDQNINRAVQFMKGMTAYSKTGTNG